MERQQEDLLDSMAQLQQQLDAAAAAAAQQPPAAATPPASGGAAGAAPPPPDCTPPPSTQHTSRLLRCQKEALEAQYEATLTVNWAGVGRLGGSV